MIAPFTDLAKLHAANNDPFVATIDLDQALTRTPEGTPGREENEFKLVASGPPATMRQNAYILGKIRSALDKSLQNELLWKTPSLVASDFYVMEIGLGTFCFLDIYLDTEDGLNYRNDISYRVRYRWHRRSAMFRYLLGSEDAQDFPHRCEYQLKVYDRPWSQGFNDCQETRFEYRNASFPFKTRQNAPPPPWPVEEYLRPAITGKTAGYNVNTTVAYAQAIKRKTGLTGSLTLKPTLVIATVRRRIHLGIKNEFGHRAAELGMGAATNADNALLMTLDTSNIYGKEFLDVHLYAKMAKRRQSMTPRLKKRLKDLFQPLATLDELEFELERNIESAISYEIEQSDSPKEKERLATMKQAFLADLKTTVDTVSEAVAAIGITTEPGTQSKYRQAYQAVFPQPSNPQPN